MQSPPNSRLIYNVTWPGGLVVESSAQIRGIVQSAIAAKGLQVIAASDNTGFFYTSQPGFSLTVIDTVGHAQVNDVKLVIDHEVYNAGRTPNSTIALTVPAPASTVPTDPTTGLPISPPTQPTDLGQWISDNWIWLALGLGAYVAVEELL